MSVTVEDGMPTAVVRQKSHRRMWNCLQKDIVLAEITYTIQTDIGKYAADVLHWEKSIAMYMTMTGIPSAMTAALTGR